MKQKRDKIPWGFWSFQKCTQCYSSSALVKLSIRGRNAWLYSQRLESLSYHTQPFKAGSVIQSIELAFIWQSGAFCCVLEQFSKCSPFPSWQGRWERTCKAPQGISFSKCYLPAKPDSTCMPQALHHSLSSYYIFHWDHQATYFQPVLVV